MSVPAGHVCVPAEPDGKTMSWRHCYLASVSPGWHAERCVCNTVDRTGEDDDDRDCQVSSAFCARNSL